MYVLILMLIDSLSYSHLTSICSHPRHSDTYVHTVLHWVLCDVLFEKNRELLSEGERFEMTRKQRRPCCPGQAPQLSSPLLACNANSKHSSVYYMDRDQEKGLLCKTVVYSSL